MDPLSISASIFSLFQLTFAVVGYVNDVKDAPLQCQNFVEEISTLMGLLTSLKNRAQRASAGDDWFQQLRLLNAHNGPLEQYKQALLLVQSRVKPGIGRRILWSFSKDEINRIMARVERLKGLIVVALQMDHFKLSEAIKEVSQAIKDDVATITQTLSGVPGSLGLIEQGIGAIQLETHSVKDDTTFIRDSVSTMPVSLGAIELGVGSIAHETTLVKDDTTVIRDSLPSLQANTSIIMHVQRSQKHEDMLQWLTKTDFANQQREIISRRQDNTAQWFLDSPQFKKWLDGSDRTLFCPGIPGAGKTMMVAIGVEHVFNATRSNKDVGMACVFCSYKARHEQTPSDLLAALLKQLVQDREDLAGPVQTLYNQYRGSKAPHKDLYGAFRSVCTALKTVYLFVDALDEFGDRDSTRTEFIHELLDLQGSMDPSLEVRATDGDVRTFVESQIPRLPRFVQCDNDLQRMIVDTITQAADGMFLLTRLHVDSLHDKRNKAKVLATLGRISHPSGSLDEAYSAAYDDALERIDSQSPDDRSLARRAMCWISYAQRQLTVQELCCALAIERGDRSLNVDNLYDIDDVVSVCAGLVTVEGRHGAVRLVHKTTQEYCIRVRADWCPQAQEDIAAACLTYLCFDAFRRGGCSRDVKLCSDWTEESWNKLIAKIHERCKEHPLLEYLAQFWSRHVHSAQIAVSDLAMNFLCDQNLVESLLEVTRRRPKNLEYSYTSEDASPKGLHIAANYGLQHLVGLLLQSIQPRFDVNSLNNNSDTPLSLASKNGHEPVVSLLLGIAGIQIDTKNGRGQTPLSLAAWNGHEAVVRLLMASEEVDINSRDKYDYTPMSRAADAGREAIVRLLLASDEVEIDSKNRADETPLTHAAWRGYVSIVRLLLSTNKVDVNSRSKGGKTPLLCAAEYGQTDVVDVLLGVKDIELNAVDEHEKTPLLLAAGNGHLKVVKLLLDVEGIDVDSKDEFSNTALMLAAEDGQLETVQLLLDNGKALVDTEDTDGRTPLSLAARRGHFRVVKVLLGTSAANGVGKVDVNTKDFYGRTPLMLAAKRGYFETIELLLEVGDIEIDTKDRKGMTALGLALKHGYDDIVELLLSQQFSKHTDSAGDRDQLLYDSKEETRSTEFYSRSNCSTDWSQPSIDAELETRSMEDLEREQDPWAIFWDQDDHYVWERRRRASL